MSEDKRKTSLESPSIKKPKKRKARMSMRKKEEGKVLTFVDMSHLSYLSKSVSNNAFLNKKHETKAVVIPENTKAAIVEDVSEEDYTSEESSGPENNLPIVKDMSVQEVANEIFEQILNVIFEAHDPNHVYKYEIVDN